MPIDKKNLPIGKKYLPNDKKNKSLDITIQTFIK